MKIDLGRVQRLFDETLRRANCQAWETISRFASVLRAGYEGEVVHLAVDLGLDVGDEIDEADAGKKLAALTDALSQVISDYAQLPGIRVVEHLQGLRSVNDVQIPAGCDPASPAEIQSAFKRATEYIGNADSYTILIPAGSQDWFYAALDGDTPACMPGGTQVRLVPVGGLLNTKSVDNTYESADQYLAALDAAAREASWYVISDTKRKPFTFYERQRLHLLGPKLVAQAKFALTANEVLKSCVRVSPSKIVIARDIPSAPLVLAEKT